MSMLRLFQPALVPGLLQTPEYIRAILQRHNLSEAVITRTINGRLERQAVLYDNTVRFTLRADRLRLSATGRVLLPVAVRPGRLRHRVTGTVTAEFGNGGGSASLPSLVYGHDNSLQFLDLRSGRSHIREYLRGCGPATVHLDTRAHLFGRGKWLP